MPLLPAFPREPLARLRFMSLGFVLFALTIGFSELALGRVAQPNARAMGLITSVILAAWAVWGYRRGKFPEYTTPFEALLMVPITAGSQMPLRMMGIFLAMVMLRSLYVSRREFWLMPLSYGLARAVGLSLTINPPYGPVSWTVFMQFVGLALISGILFLVKLAVERQTEAEAALARSEERYRLLAVAAHDVIYDWDVRSGAISFSEAMRSVFGFDPGASGRDRAWWVDRVVAADRGYYDEVIAGLLASTANVRAGIRYRMRGASEERLVIETAVVQRGPAGDALRVVSAVRDVTSENSLEEQLREAQKMEAVGQLAGGVAHDFNNLLTVIGGHVYMVEHSVTLTPDAKRHLGGITHTIERAGVLTKQLLAFGRRQLLHPRVVDLNVVINDAVKLITPAVGDSIEVNTDLEPKLAAVRADVGQLEQVLLNLALNARDAMPRGGALRISTANIETPAGPRARLSVHDCGTGMDAATLARVFEPFFTTKTPGRGTGLGLSTAYGIIKQSGGDIAVESSLGHGTTFTITLPVVARSAPVATTKRTSGGGDESDGKLSGITRVLLVEDDEGVRQFAREVLTRAGATVVEAHHGAHGLEVAERERHAFDLVVSDVVMPELSGPQMVERLREKNPTLRVLFITGYADDAVARENLRAGHESLLEKPFSARALREAIQVLAESQAPVLAATRD
jgi:two-component system cell cycle sensor histidine kinase/response regulator CckA